MAVNVGLVGPHGYVLFLNENGQVAAPFDRYPQPKDAHPKRPWWRYWGGAWVRRDGVRMFTAVDQDTDESYSKVIRGEEILDGREVDLSEGLQAVDYLWPLEVPPLRLGQVWRVRGVEWSADNMRGMTPQAAFASLDDVQLLYGPWAPWAHTPTWNP